MSARKRDVNGWFQVDANPISRVGVFFYSGKVISPDLEPDKMYAVFRPPEELSDPEFIESVKLLPWADDHPARLFGDDEPVEDHGIEGVIGEKVFFDPTDGTLKANIKCFSKRHENLVNAGKRELSFGYRCKYEYAPGEWNGKPYQFVQRHLRGNHLSTVGSGRMGPSVGVMDGFRFTIDSAEFRPMKKTNQIRRMMNSIIKYAQDAEENPDLEEQEKGEIDTLKGLISQAAPLMDQLASLPTIMAKTQMEEEAAEDEDDPDADLLKKAAEAQDEDGDDDKNKGKEGEDDDPEKNKAPDKKGDSAGMDAKEIRKLIVDTVKACLPKPQAPAHAMDAKEMMVQIGRRDVLAKQLTPFIGAFDAAEMTEAEVAKYGLGKLGITAAPGSELATIAGYLHNRQPAQPLTSSMDKKEGGSWLASQTKKEA